MEVEINTYEEFLEFCQEFDILNNQNRLKGLSKCRGESRTARLAADGILKKLTSFLPEDSSNQVRMRYVIWNRSPENLKCPVDGCSGEISWSERNTRFNVTCPCRDQKHLDYIEKIRQERAKGNQLEKYGGWAAQTEEFKEKRRKTISKIRIEIQKKTEVKKPTIKKATKKIKDKSKGKTEEFIKRSREVHGDGWDYSLVNYVNRKTKVILICPEGHKIEQLPSNHLAGNRCGVCHGKNSMTNKDFIKKAQEIHGNKYSYLKIPANIPLKEKVDILCPKHGVFNQQVSVHLSGSGCPECANVSRINLEKFIKKAQEIHGNKYDYSEISEVTKITQRVDIKCNLCKKSFNTIISNHIYSPNFCGCPNCSTSGFNPDKPAILYYLKDTETSLYKIGITNKKSIEERFGKAFCSKRAIALKEQSFISGQEALEYEQEILEQFAYARCTNDKWPEKLGGRTEFFKYDILGLDLTSKEYYNYLKNHPGNFLNKTGMFADSKKIQLKYKEDYRILRNQLKYFTVWLPEYSTDIDRMRALKHDMSEENYFCPVCRNPKRYSSKNQAFRLTCNKKDIEHQNYIYDHISIAREKTNIEKYGVKHYTETEEFKRKSLETLLNKYHVDNAFKSKYIQQKIKETNSLKYGGHPMKNKGIKDKNRTSIINNLPKDCTSPAQLHLKNKDKLTKEYLEENFLDKNGHIKLQEMMQFYNMKEAACYYYMRNNNIKIKYKDGGFNPDKPAILYYLKDTETGLYKIGITNNTVEERFGKAFCSKRAIALKEQSFLNGQEALEYEQEILEQFAYARCTNDKWPIKLGGRTEFFNCDILGLDLKV